MGRSNCRKLPNMRMQSDIQLTEAHRTPNNINPNKNTPRHIIVKIPDIQQKNRILKAAGEKKQITFKGKPIRIMADFSSQTMKSRRAWSRVLQVLHEHKFQPRLLYPCLLYTSPSPRDKRQSRMPSSA